MDGIVNVFNANKSGGWGEKEEGGWSVDANSHGLWFASRGFITLSTMRSITNAQSGHQTRIRACLFRYSRFNGRSFIVYTFAVDLIVAPLSV